VDRDQLFEKQCVKLSFMFVDQRRRIKIGTAPWVGLLLTLFFSLWMLSYFRTAAILVAIWQSEENY
jgi:hypothetical protein